MKKFFIIIFSFVAIHSIIAKPDPNKAFYIQHWKTDNGVPVYFLRRPELKFADITVLFAAGSAYDQANLGIANATSQMISAGTHNKNAMEIAKDFERYGAEFLAETDRDKTRLSLRTLTTDDILEKNINLFSQIINTPTFPDAELKRIKNEIVTTIRLQNDKPNEFALERFYSVVYQDHPYAHNPLGNEVSIQKLSSTQLKQFYNQYYNRKNAKIVIAGDMTRNQAKQIANKLSDNMRPGQRAKKIKSTPPLTQSISKFIQLPTLQSTIIVGRDGVTRQYKKMMALRLANHILGVLPLDSVLFKKVRKDEGLVYGVSSHLLPYQSGGVFFVILQTKNDTAKKAATLTKLELNAFSKEPLHPNLLKIAKKQFIDSFPLSLYSNAALIANLENIAFYNQPLDYLQTFPDKIKALNAQDVEAAFNDLNNNHKLVTIIAGGKPQAK